MMNIDHNEKAKSILPFLLIILNLSSIETKIKINQTQIKLGSVLDN